jgi:hypothetical protein
MPPANASVPEDGSDQPRRSIADSSIRVDVDLLDT